MADKIKFREEAEIDPEKLQTAQSYNRKLQELGRSMVSLLYMLVRNVKLYDPTNTIFEKPLEQLRGNINTILSSERSLTLQCAGASFYLNNMLLRVDLKASENLRKLSLEFERRDVGGFQLDQPITTEELQNFIWLFAREREEIGGRKVLEHKLATIKVRRFEKLREILSRRPLDAGQVQDRHLDRKRYALVVYARLIVFLRKLFLGLRGEGAEISPWKSTPLIQDMVDVCYGHGSNFLGVTSRELGPDWLCYHSANTSVLAIVFGNELGFAKGRLRELGQAALFHDIGKVDLPPDLLLRPPADDQERGELVRAPLLTVRRLMCHSPLNFRAIQCILAAYNHTLPFGRPVRDHLNRVHHVVRGSNLGVFDMIVALVDCYEHLMSFRGLRNKEALALMEGGLQARFDPDLLRIFTGLMKGAVQRDLAGGGKLDLFEC